MRTKPSSACFQASHGAGFERRLEAVKILWEALLNVTRNTPSIVALTDILVEKEYQTLLTEDRWRQLVDQLTDDQFKKISDATQAAESARPFAMEQLYAILFVYRGIVGRIIILMMNGRKSGVMPFWPRDTGVQQHLRVVLSDEELSEFQNGNIAHYTWVRLKLEAKFLLAAQTLVLGQETADKAVRESAKILEELRQLETDKK